ncbi:hypothetical protein JYU34_019825 [Plutella xylostella]|uniref:Uncharacterized protein n=1 Tax=Plutella xylostella TaxID=51655 RepID=A0ABQ7PVX7_PLUXY|nr:hypothetical protein JYU34_019825 [Plutella xylostella]
MVNYCCVHGCGRNSKTHSRLNFYTFPKEKHRQVEWLMAVRREDLLESVGEKALTSRRICSRHFSTSSVKNKCLSPHAVPTLHIMESKGAPDMAPVKHDGIVCNNCESTVTGFRYKCLSCVDYDLCNKCETLEAHPEHHMIRIPRPVKFGNIEYLTQESRKLIKAEFEDVAPPDQNNAEASSDDEPITHLMKRKHDEGIDLSEDVKRRIRKEVVRALESEINKEAADDKVLNAEILVNAGENENLDDLLVSYLRSDRIVQAVEFANVSVDTTCLPVVKHEDLVQTVDQPITSVADSLSEFLIKKT